MSPFGPLSELTLWDTGVKQLICFFSDKLLTDSFFLGTVKSPHQNADVCFLS